MSLLGPYMYIIYISDSLILKGRRIVRTSIMFEFSFIAQVLSALLRSKSLSVRPGIEAGAKYRRQGWRAGGRCCVCNLPSFSLHV